MALSARTQAEGEWWASLTPEQRRMARDEEALREMLPKIKVEFAEPRREYTPEERQRAEKLLFDFFIGSRIKQAIGIMFAPEVGPGEFTAHDLSLGCVVCQETIWTGSKYRRYSGWVLHSKCVDQGLEWKESLEKREAFNEKWQELLAIRGEVEQDAGRPAEPEETTVAQTPPASIFDRARRLPAGTLIPKPEAKGEFRIKGLGRRRGETAIIYTIPSHTGRKPYEKGITKSELEAAAQELAATGELTREWFNEPLPACAKEGGCNFTTIGGLMELLGVAEYGERGVYRGLPDA